MLHDLHYLPVLNAKQGEFQALEVTASDVRDRMTPLLNVRERNVNDRGEPRKDLERYFGGITDDLVNRWGEERPVLVDLGPMLEGDVELLEPGECWEELRAHTTDKNLRVIPVTAPERDDPYQEAIVAFVSAADGALCMRLVARELSSPRTLAQRLEDLLEGCRTDPSSTYLVVDLQDQLTPLVAALLPTLPFVNDWYGLVLVGGSFPDSLGNLRSGRISREEWRLWQHVREELGGLSRTPAFGDYGTRAAVSVDAPFTPAPNLRYTIEDDWLIRRGFAGPRSGGWDQIYQLCADLAAEPEFLGGDYSWGDAWIQARADGDRSGPGNPTTWITVSLSHHLRLTTDQLARLRDS